MGSFQCRLRRLILTNFRSYSHIKFDFDSPFIGFVGDNGVGKTNLLEAISLLSPGRGLRNARLSDMLLLGDSRGFEDKGSWSVYAEGDFPYGSSSIGTGFGPKSSEKPEQDKRTLRIDHKDVVGQSALESLFNVVWMTPSMDGLLGEASSVRRRFLDKLVTGFIPSHRRHLYRYEQALRERSTLIREGKGDKIWMKTLEETLAQEGVAVTSSRLDIIRVLNQSMRGQTSPFPQATLTLNGWMEGVLERSPALEVEEQFAAKLEQARKDDPWMTQGAIGPQCADLEILHNQKNHLIGLCSMGEQKAMLISILLAYMNLQVLKRNQTPLFLFDEGFVHLDEKRRHYLMEALRDLHVQTFFTSADLGSVQELMSPGDTLFEIAEGTPGSGAMIARKI